MTSERVRVRFAPSPTGMLHVGNARTALYNWLFARRLGGDFLLRIEDTDVERSEPRYEKQLIEDLLWLGLDWDEGPGTGRPGDPLENERGRFGPYRQSERQQIYAELTGKLLAEGKAYRCFCTPEELMAEHQQAVREHKPQVYSGRCRNLSAAEAEQRMAAGLPFAVRLKIGPEPLGFHDIVRGPVEFAAETVSDPVLVRSEVRSGVPSHQQGAPGMPVYNYVVTIDDALMQITHVIRGDDHISNTPKQVAIYKAFGWPVPEFAHLSTILGADRERLSKRHGATSVASFREMGYLPEALVNYLALLGWGAEDGKTETFTLEELTRAFKLERVTPSPAVFDLDKLNWLNRHSIKLASASRLVDLVWASFGERLPAREAASEAVVAWMEQLVELFAPSVDKLDELAPKAAFVFGFDPDAARMLPENQEVLAADSARIVLAELADRARANSANVTPQVFKTWMNEIKVAAAVKGKELFHPVRIALTGMHSGPEFDRLVPLIEEGAELGLGIPCVQQRVERFVGV
ncbi:MAG: glutamate--tRNA ligase [Acidobacteriota bacterium]|nr:glutamate--tRNA ligase [Acidobacteriota bacterium]